MKTGSTISLERAKPDTLNEFLIANGVAGVPGNAFANSDLFDNYLRFCIAREDEILHSALDKLQATFAVIISIQMLQLADSTYETHKLTQNY